MGQSSTFECPKCGYSAMVAGGDDCGFTAGTTTIQCDNCKIIEDVITTETPWDKDSITPISGLKCPHCSGPVSKWTGKKCPVCKTKMIPTGLMMLWD